jgi:hypothetical protein
MGSKENRREVNRIRCQVEIHRGMIGILRGAIVAGQRVWIGTGHVHLHH